MDKIKFLKEVIEKVDNGGLGSVKEIALLLTEQGIESNFHVGKPKDFFSNNDVIAEWYLGQFLNVIETESWFVMNSLINQSYSWTNSIEVS